VRLQAVWDFPDASQFLWDLLNERQPHQSISHRGLPTREQHDAFVAFHPYRCWFIVLESFPDLGIAEAPVGQVYATKANKLGVTIKAEFQGRWLGKAAVKALMATCEPLPAIAAVRAGAWLANINPNNERSIHMFEELGFKHVSNTYRKD
jgi:GNAT superfamily N-acetyltransferase